MIKCRGGNVGLVVKRLMKQGTIVSDGTRWGLKFVNQGEVCGGDCKGKLKEWQDDPQNAI